MPAKTKHRTTLRELTAARSDRGPRAMLTCYDFTSATLLAEAGIDFLLVGDSAGNVILGHDTTVPVPQRLLVDLCQAVRRGHPSAHLTLDAAFDGHFGDEGARRLVRAFKRSDADALKIEVTSEQLPLVRKLASVGVPVIAHIGLTAQHVLRTGGYRFQGRTAAEARRLAYFAKDLQEAGAVALLLEAVTPPATKAVRDEVDLPIIGCGAGPGCAAYILVLHDLLGLSPRRPKFVPDLAHHGNAAHTSVREAMLHAMRGWHTLVDTGRYPARRHCYPMSDAQRRLLLGLAPEHELPDDELIDEFEEMNLANGHEQELRA